MEEPPEPERLQYANSLELILSLISYAVGLGNVWRFPYLVYENGGGTFLVPYVLSLALMGVPMFILELGLGQLLREGTVNIWVKLQLPKLRGVGVAATVTTFTVSVYYATITTWSMYYMGRTLGSIGSGSLPWEDTVPGTTCPTSVLFPSNDVFFNTDLLDENNIFNPDYKAKYFCPEGFLPNTSTVAPRGYTKLEVIPSVCPGGSAISFWNNNATQGTGDIADLGGIHPGLWVSYTLTWLILYFILFKGVAVSGKVAYVTSILPYVCLICFFFRSITLPNASAGLKFYLTPDFSKLLDIVVWQKAATQIFYSLGIGFGSLVSFGSYGAKTDDYFKHALRVSLINCGTSVFAGFVVFGILGFLADEISHVNPCFDPTNIASLESLGLSGTGLAFIAFPVAISRLGGKHFWAFLFFVMLFALGLGSGFSYGESIVTVISDSGYANKWPRWKTSAVVCLVTYFLGFIFITRAGENWVTLFDSYCSVVSVFLAAMVEAGAVMWLGKHTFLVAKTTERTGRRLPDILGIVWKYVVPTFSLVLTVLAVQAFDLTGKKGEDKFPSWALYFGWFIGLLPVLSMVGPLFTEPPNLSMEDVIDGLSEPVVRSLTSTMSEMSKHQHDV